LKERETLEHLAKRFELAPTQISLWKAKAISNFDLLFGVDKKKSKKPEVDVKALYAQIGERKYVSCFVTIIREAICL
jgi:transposase